MEQPSVGATQMFGKVLKSPMLRGMGRAPSADDDFGFSNYA